MSYPRHASRLETGLPILTALALSVAISAPAPAQEVQPGDQVIVVRPMPAGPPLPPPPPPPPSVSVSFSGGWARLDSSGGDSLVDGEDGWYFDTDFAKRLKPESPLWLGVGLTGSYYSESEDRQLSSGLFPTFVEVDASLSMFSIEPRLTYVLLPRQERGVYLAGRIGAGLLIADYWATGVVERAGGFFIDGDEETVAAFEVRPAAQLGFCGGNWAVGAEVSQMWAWGDFDPLGDELTETRAGIFFTFRY